MALRRLTVRCLTPLVLAMMLLHGSAEAAARQEPPSFTHGLGQMIWGLTMELPKTVAEATLNGPPVVGTAVGLLAGTSQAIQKTVAGFFEMAAGFNPWGAKR